MLAPFAKMTNYLSFLKGICIVVLSLTVFASSCRSKLDSTSVRGDASPVGSENPESNDPPEEKYLSEELEFVDSEIAEVNNLSSLTLEIANSYYTQVAYKFDSSAANCSLEENYSIIDSTNNSVTVDLVDQDDGVIVLCLLGYKNEKFQDPDTGIVLSWVKDTIAPTIQFTAPGSGYINTSNEASFTLNGTCSEEAATIEFVGSVNLTTTCSSGAFSAAVNFSGAADGAITVTALLSDLAGNSTTSSEMSLTKDTNAPTIQFTAPGSEYINISNEASFALSGTCSEEAATIEFEGSVNVTTTCSSGVFSEAVDFSEAADGAITITATLSDLAGNSTTSTELSLTKDTIAPTIQFTAPGSEYINISNEASFTLTGTCSEEAATIEFEGSLNVTTTCSSGTFSTALDFSEVADGAIVVTATLSDQAGNSTTSTELSLTKDTVAPNDPVLTASAGDVSTSIEIEYSVNSETPALQEAKILRKAGTSAPTDCEDGVEIVAIDTFDQAVSFVDFTSTTEAAYSYSICLVDVAGNLHKKDLANIISASMMPKHRFSFGGGCYDVVSSGNYFYCSSGRGVDIFDVTANPEEPLQVGELHIPGYNYNINIFGSYLFVAGADYGFSIYDITVKSAPTLVVNKAVESAVIRDVYSDGSYVYLSDSYSVNPRLLIYNIADMSNPTLAGSVALTGAPYQMDKLGDLFFVASGTAGLHIIDIEDKSSPTLVKTVDTPGQGYDVKVKGSYAYVADFGGTNFQIIDIADPANAAIVGVRDIGGYSRNMLLDGNTLYLSSYYGDSIYIYDLSVTPAAPTVIGNVNSGNWNIGVAKIGSYLYVGAEVGGLSIFNISTPATPTYVKKWRGDNTFRVMSKFNESPNGKYACTGGAEGFFILNVEDPSNIHVVYSNPALAVYACQFYLDDYLVTGGNGSAFKMWDITDAANPVEISALAGMHYDFKLVGDHIYSAGNSGDFRITNIEDPENPVLVGSLPIGNTSNFIEVDGDYAYIVTNSAGLKIVDISDKALPTVLTTYDFTGYGWNSFAKWNDYLFIGNYQTGGTTEVTVIDVSTPATPTEYSSYTMRSAKAFAVRGDYGYLTTNNTVEVWDLTDLPNRLLQTIDTTSVWGNATLFVSERYLYVGSYYSGASIYTDLIGLTPLAD